VLSFAYGFAAQAIGFSPPVRSEGDLARLFGAGWVGLALSVVLVVIIGPVVEELIFRGVLLSAAQGVFEGRVPGAGWMATAFSALVFALYHFTAWLFVPTFILGLALGWVTRSRGGLWPAIVLHALYNLVPIAAAFYAAT
jgi:membrane protease YdiL (CAAX protease family)